jgi:hypothetical protein
MGNTTRLNNNNKKNHSPPNYRGNFFTLDALRVFMVARDGVVVPPMLGGWVGASAREQRSVGGEGRCRWRERFEDFKSIH